MRSTSRNAKSRRPYPLSVAYLVALDVAGASVPVAGPDRVHHALSAPVKQPKESFSCTSQLGDPVRGLGEHGVVHVLVDVTGGGPAGGPVCFFLEQCCSQIDLKKLINH